MEKKVGRVEYKRQRKEVRNENGKVVGRKKIKGIIKEGERRKEVRFCLCNEESVSHLYNLSMYRDTKLFASIELQQYVWESHNYCE